MPARFQPSANAWSRRFLAVAALTPVVALLTWMGWMRTPYARGELRIVEQPVPFDHRHHVADDRIDCRYCHTEVDRAATAGMPSAARCMGCHAQIWNDSPLLEPVRESYFEGRPIRWRRVHDLPDFVFFDHSVHVAAGVGCESCHGRVDRMARVYQVKPLTMGWCLDCHRDPRGRLRPVEAVTAMGWEERGPAGAAGDPVPAREEPATLLRTDCTACHR